MRAIEDITDVGELLLINDILDEYNDMNKYYSPLINSAIDRRDTYKAMKLVRQAAESNTVALSLLDQMESAQKTMEEKLHRLGVIPPWLL